jgi:hypothetical protein
VTLTHFSPSIILSNMGKDEDRRVGHPSMARPNNAPGREIEGSAGRRVKTYPAIFLRQGSSFFLMMKKLSSSSKSGEKAATILKPIFS